MFGFKFPERVAEGVIRQLRSERSSSRLSRVVFEQALHGMIVLQYLSTKLITHFKSSLCTGTDLSAARTQLATGSPSTSGGPAKFACPARKLASSHSECTLSTGPCGKGLPCESLRNLSGLGECGVSPREKTSQAFQSENSHLNLQTLSAHMPRWML